MQATEAAQAVDRARAAGWSSVEIAAYLGCSVATTYGWAKKREKPSTVNAAIARRLRQMVRLLDRREGSDA